MSAPAKPVCAIVTCAALAACGGSSGAPAPRLAPIPLQQVPGTGAMFALDVEPFVVEPSQPLTYAVVAGGGSFAGSVYSNMFDTLGTYQVAIRVAYPGDATTDAFEVEVQTANLAVVRVDGRSLTLLDTDTGRLVVASATSHVETFMAGLASGHSVFERHDGTTHDLFAFDLAGRQTWTLGDSRTFEERFEATTSTGHVVFSSGSATDTDLLLWNAATGLTRPISLSGNEHDRNALVNRDDLVFYERGVNGQADIWVYDPANDASTAVSSDPSAESLLAVLPDGAVVFSRAGSLGESDLYWYRPGGSVAEVGGDLGAAADPRSKTFHAGTTAGQVVFSVATSPTSKSLYLWQGGASAAIDIDEDLTYRAIGAHDVVVYTIAAGGQDDVYCFDVPNDTPGSPTAVSTDAAGERVEAVVSKGSSSYVIYTRAAGPDSVHVYDVSSPGTADLTDPAGVEVRGVLANGDVVCRLADGSAVLHLDPASATATPASGGLSGTAMDFAGAGRDDGDFVLVETVGGQTDLHLWDHSAAARITVSNAAGDDAFQAMTTAGRVLFTRVIPGNPNADLFVFDPAAASEQRLTAADSAGLLHDHEVVGSYTADRR